MSDRIGCYRCRPGVHSPTRVLALVHPIELNLFEREEPMSDRLFRLMERHQKLDRMIAAAQKRRFGNPFELLRLKKLKLAIKDRIAAATRKQTALSR